MKVLVLLSLLFPVLSFAQSNETWHSFIDQSTDYKGFKNSNGVVMLQAKFGLFTIAKKFDKVMAVCEFQNDSTFQSYYLLKDGRKFGQDSLYIFDYMFACESEGFIKFKNTKKDLTGFFNSNAKVAIPAEYNWASQIKNGVFVGLKNAEKNFWDKHEHSDCNHWSWEGGNMFLMDCNNNILIENFEYSENLDFYSLKVSKEISTDKTRVNFKGVNGKYYSFLDNEKAFEVYFSRLTNNLTLENLIKNSFSKIVHFGEKGWTADLCKDFFNKNGDLIIDRFEQLKNNNLEYSITLEHYTPVPKNLNYIFDERKDNCGMLNISKYPSFQVLINFKDEKGEFSHQDKFTFIKVGKTYKLLSVGIKGI